MDMLAEATKTVSLLQHVPAGSPAWPERAPPPRLHPLNVRVQVSLSEGLRVMAFATGWKMQDLVAKFVEDGLDQWNREWRQQIPEKFRGE